MSENRFSLAGKTVVLTGAAGILGKLFSRELLSAGASLAMVDRKESDLVEYCRELQKQFTQSKIDCFTCDISREEDVQATCDAINSVFGNIHVLHNNAATKGSELKKFFEPFESFDLGVWREIMQTNVDGYFLMAKHVGKHMVDQRIRGSIIQTASIYGLVAPDQRIYEGSEYLGMGINTPAVYSVSKAAVIGLTQYLSTYWGEAGIRVNTLTPGGIQSGQNEIFNRKYSNRVPLGRMGMAEELAGALIYLASDASSYVTGQNLVVDGGLSVW